MSGPCGSSGARRRAGVRKVDVSARCRAARGCRRGRPPCFSGQSEQRGSVPGGADRLPTSFLRVRLSRAPLCRQERVCWGRWDRRPTPQEFTVSPRSTGVSDQAARGFGPSGL